MKRAHFILPEFISAPFDFAATSDAGSDQSHVAANDENQFLVPFQPRPWATRRPGAPCNRCFTE